MKSGENFIDWAEKRFRKKPTIRLDSRNLILTKYLNLHQINYPSSLNWASSLKSKHLSPMLNNKLKCCAVAGAGSLIQLWSSVIGKESILSDSCILKAYEQVSGYILDQPSTDIGCSELNLLKYWRKKGIGGHKILAYTSVDCKNAGQIKAAIHLFGGIYTGFSIPTYLKKKKFVLAKPIDVLPNGSVTDIEPNSSMGHCIPIVGYNSKFLYGISFGKIVKFTWSFFMLYCDEAYAALDKDWGENLNIQSAFDFQALLKDLQVASK